MNVVCDRSTRLRTRIALVAFLHVGCPFFPIGNPNATEAETGQTSTASTTSVSSTSFVTEGTTSSTTSSTTQDTTESSSSSNGSSGTSTGTTGFTQTTEQSTSSSSTGGPVCDPEQALVDPDCNTPDKPYCVGVDTCGSCSELGKAGKDCSDIDPDKTVCNSASGLCVQCTKDDTSACPPEKPGCGYDDVCAPCTEHRECPNTACDIEEGVCFPDDSVIYVKNDFMVCTGGNGTMAKPFCNFQVALGTLMPGQKTTIKVIPGGVASMKPLALVAPGYILAVVSSNKQIPALDGKGNTDSTIEVSTGSRVYVSKLRFQYSGSPSVLQCTSGTLYLDDIKIEGDGANTAKALDAVNCKTVIQRSRIFKNYLGIQVTGGSISLENSHVGQNGKPNSAFGAFNLLNGATARINYSSIGLNSKTLSASVFKCAPGIGQILLRNSAVLASSPMYTADCMAAIKQEMGLVEEVPVAEEQSLFDTWFNGLVDGALVAGANSPLANKATWAPDDPRYDYEGDARPLMGPGFAGADEP